jgi:nucleoside-diphosphate-sugar epimerase
VNTRVLILGGAGAIGRELTRYFRSKDDHVDVLDVALDLNQDLQHLNLSDLDTYRCVYFLAWDVGGSKYIADQDTQFNQFLTNTRISSNIIPQLHHSRVPFVFISSQLAGADESAYSLTKLLGEKLCTSYSQSNARVIRQWNVYGVEEIENQKSHVITDMIRSAIKYGEIRLITDGRERRQFVHVNDVCKAYDLVADLHPDVYQVNSGHWIQIIEVAKLLGEMLNVSVKPGSQKGISPKGVLAKDIPGWSTSMSLEDGLQSLVTKYVS